MAHKIKNLKHFKSEETRARAASSGAANLAAYREKVGKKTALKHGVDSLTNSGELPPGLETIAVQVDEIVAAMVADLGGVSELTAQKRALLASQRLCLLVMMLSGDYLAREGLVNKRGRPHRLLATAACYGNLLRRNAESLGLERRPKDALTFEAVMQEYAEPQKGTEDAEAKDA